MEEIVALCKRRGFVFPSSEIYGGLGSTYDYGRKKGGGNGAASEKGAADSSAGADKKASESKPGDSKPAKASASGD